MMKKMLLPILIVLLFVLSTPGYSYSSYRIVLKNGGEYVTEQYTLSEGQIVFENLGGTIRLPGSMVRIVDESKLPVPQQTGSIRSAPKAPATGRQDVERNDVQDPDGDLLKTSGIKKTSLKAYKKENRRLKTDLGAALSQMRSASMNRDAEGKEEARRALTEISGRIYDLTDELKAETGGVLPQDWWSGVEGQTNR
jgi:hypothetical protein